MVVNVNNGKSADFAAISLPGNEIYAYYYGTICSTVFSDLAAPPQDLSCGPLPSAGPDLAGGRPGAQPNYGSISVTGVALGAHKTRSSRP